MGLRGEEDEIMNTILVTGGAGFIGSNFVHMAISQGKKVINLDSLTYAGNLESLQTVADHPNYTFIQGEIGDSLLLDKVLSECSPNAVVNFAAESHVDRSIEGPAAFIQTNIVGTFTLLESVKKYWKNMIEVDKCKFRFLHVSTDEVFGSLGEEGYFTEETSYAPNSPYSASKASSDHLVRAYHHTYGLPVLTTNCSNNYGPYQFPEKLIPLMILNALAGKALPIYGDGMNVRDWLYVEDHCSAILSVLENGKIGETYNIGGHNEKSNIEIVHKICDLLDKARPKDNGTSYLEQITFVKDRPGHDRRYAIDATKIKNELGWVPLETFESGIEKTIQWYLNNFQWCLHIYNGSYRGERLGVIPEEKQ